MRGNDGDEFYRYDILNNQWETLPSLPIVARAGSDISYIGNHKIAIVFSGVAEFYVYNIDTSTFENKTSPPISSTYRLKWVGNLV